MPRILDPGDGDAIGLDDLFAILDDTHVDVRDEEAFATLGPALARLGRNPTFLADLAIRELADRCDAQARDNGYGAQVFLLRPPDGRFVVRANFWPSEGDPGFGASGASAFFYGLPHDHNFPFLTYGYLGPGYWSDYYEVDPDRLEGRVGEDARLRFVERSRLEQGKLMLYRMRRDVHSQAPPDAFSVSLNILGHDPAQPWTDQYRYDLKAGTIDGILTTTPGEALLAIGTRFGGGNGIDLAARFAASHRCERMRVTAIDALHRVDSDRARPMLERIADDPSRRIAAAARDRLAQPDPNRTDRSASLYRPR